MFHNRLNYEPCRTMWRVANRLPPIRATNLPPRSVHSTCSALRISGWGSRSVRYPRRVSYAGYPCAYQECGHNPAWTCHPTAPHGVNAADEQVIKKLDKSERILFWEGHWRLRLRLLGIWVQNVQLGEYEWHDSESYIPASPTLSYEDPRFCCHHCSGLHQPICYRRSTQGRPHRPRDAHTGIHCNSENLSRFPYVIIIFYSTPTAYRSSCLLALIGGATFWSATYPYAHPSRRRNWPWTSLDVHAPQT
jgi:hypothetical protein